VDKEYKKILLAGQWGQLWQGTTKYYPHFSGNKHISPATRFSILCK